jgi:hypothetical protein
MPFLIRPSRRFPVCCPVTYQCGDFEGHGIVWNVSLTGWRVSGNLPLRIGEVCSLTVNLPTQETIYVAAGIVRWMRGEELWGRNARDGRRVTGGYGATSGSDYRNSLRASNE